MRQIKPINVKLDRVGIFKLIIIIFTFMNIIFQVDGGIGKSILATAVCKAIKTQYPNDI